MSMNAINSEHILKNYGGNNVNSLNHILEFDVDDELHLLQNSQYFDAKIDQLKIKIQQYKNDNCEFSAICLQETWLDSNADTSLLQIDDYTLIPQGKTCSETNTHVTIGNINRPPRDVNENYQQFTDEFTRQLAKFQKSKWEVIIAGDYNIDMLKINNKPKITEYFDSILEHSFFPEDHIPY